MLSINLKALILCIFLYYIKLLKKKAQICEEIVKKKMVKINKKQKIKCINIAIDNNKSFIYNYDYKYRIFKLNLIKV